MPYVPPSECYDPNENWTDPLRDASDAVYGKATQGKRGVAPAFGEMDPVIEAPLNALFNDGMRPERRREILGGAVAPLTNPITNLFEGLF